LFKAIKNTIWPLEQIENNSSLKTFSEMYFVQFLCIYSKSN